MPVSTSGDPPIPGTAAKAAENEGDEVTLQRSSPSIANATPDPEEAWSAFLIERASLILQVVHLFERDPDQAGDCFLFVCEGLRRDNRRRIHRFREDGSASFATWLRAVVRRLCLDWRRHRDGRFRLPRAILRLPELDQEVFRCIRLRGLTENESFHSLKALWPALTREQISDAAERVARAVDSRFSWLLLVRHPGLQSISAPAGSDPAEGEEGLIDPNPDPERDAVDHEQRSALAAAIARLSPRARLILRLRFDQELPLEEIARLTALSGVSQVERQIRQALDELRDRMGAEGFAGVSVKVK